MGIIFVQLLLSSLIVAFVNLVQINYIRAPQAIRNGTHRPIIIDCDYSLRPDDTNLVLQWYLNEEKIYQWVPPKKPQALGVMKKKIDTTFEATNDVYSKHRAIKINSPTTDVAGEYKCYVSTFNDEDFAVKKVIVFEPEETFQLFQSRENSGKVNFTCLASKIYPEPKIIIYKFTKEKQLERNVLQAVEWGTSRLKSGRFSVAVVSSALIEDLEAGSIINCELNIPGTGYLKKRSVLYYPAEMKNWNKASHVHIHYLHLAFVFICLIAV